MITGMIALPITVVGGAILYYRFSGKRARQRNKRNLCARCGQLLGAANTFSVSSMVVCKRCADITDRNNKIAVRFAIGLTLLLVILMAVGFGADYATGGHVDTDSTKIIVAVLASAFAFCTIIRKLRVKPVSREPSSK